MKVLHINFSDTIGGAAIAAHRHHEAMRLAGIDSKMLVIEKKSNDNNIVQHGGNKISTLLRKIYHRILLGMINSYGTWSFNGLGYDLSKDECVKDTDVIYIHWINFYTLSLSSLEKILELGKPVYWFMHDMWAITGGCHHAFECDKFKFECKKCPLLNQKRGSKLSHDISYYQFHEKFRKLSRYPNLHFLTPSEWLASKVKESALFGDHSINVSRNVIDTNKFVIRDKKEARVRLNLPLDKKLILFGADNISSPYKGWEILKKSLNEPIDNVECVMYGDSNENVNSSIALKIHSLGRISNIDDLIDLYNACDVFLSPSLADNYPNVIVEAMACGMPVIATNVGGIPEIVKDRLNGIIVENLDHSNFRRAIQDVINDKVVFDANSIRQKIVDENSFSTILKHHPHLS